MIYLYVLIFVLVLIIALMMWFLYFQPKCKLLNNDVTSILKQKKNVSKEYFELIDNLSKFKELDDVFDKIFTELMVVSSEAIEVKEKLAKQEEVYNELTRSLGQKSKLIIDISHQMRTSLSGLLGFEKFLLETELTSKQNEYIVLMSESSQELLTLVDNILETAPRLNRNDERKFLDKLETIEKKTMPKVLIVDDNDINKRLLSKVLERFKLVVVFASNGKEAVLLRESEQYDMIFMDIEMPVMNGVDASIAIRKFELENNHAEVPIVALTANTGRRHRETYLSAGMNDYMIKPIQIDDVKKRIEKLL